MRRGRAWQAITHLRIVGDIREGTLSTLTPEGSFEILKNNVVRAISSYFPYEGKQRKLELHKVWVDDKLHTDDIKSQTEAKDLDKTWGVPVKADVSLVDKTTGKVIDRKTMTIARLPKMTNRYGFIVDGNEYQIDHLFRLKSGVYARIQDNGDLESEFNLVKGPAGNRFSILLERESKKFFLKQGDAKIPLYPILKSLGVSDDEIEKSWGKEILAANRPKTEEKTLKSLQTFWKKTSFEDQTEPSDLGGYARYVHDFFDKTVLRPDTTKITLGKPATKVDGSVLLTAANKILGVSRGTHQPDDRDSLAFKEIVSIEDFLPEKIERSMRTIRGKLRNTIDLKDKKSVSEVLSTDLFARPIREFFTKGGSLTERPDQTNPIQMMSGHRKTTLMSSDLGGIKKEHSITDEMRVINPSHFGFLDPMHTPESEKTGITLHLGMAARKNGKDLETPVFNVKENKIQYLNATDFHNSHAVLPDQVRWVGGKPVPIAENVKMKLPGGSIEVRPFREAQYVMPSAKGMFDIASNLIPFLPSNQGNRVSMADKQMEQAISLKYREEPLVQTKTDHADPNLTFEKVLGGFTSHRAPVSGKVVSVKNDSITISDGKKKHQVHLYEHFPLNDPKGMMHSEPVVKVGDTVRQGQVIADNNFTKNGTLSLGVNLRVGYIPYKGYNYEDGIVISESAAKKLTSEHLYKKKIELDPENDVISKSKFIAYAATKANQLTKEQLDLLDDDGVIRVGSKVRPGQVLIAAVGKNLTTRQGSALAALGKRAFQPYKDKSLVWDEDHVGEVVKVIKDPSGKGVKVYVKTEEPLVVGDKLSGRHGNKGIVTMILPDHEMPFTIDADGKRRPLEVLLNPTGVPTRINVGQVLETAAGKIAEKTGKPYIVNNFSGPNTNYREQVLKDLRAHGLRDEELVYDPKDPKRPLGSVLVGPQYLLKLKHQVEKKLTVRGGGTDVTGRGLPYDIDRTPTKGGERGGQGFGALDVYALLGHDARHNLREMATQKSDFQDMTFWNMVQEGHEPPPPKPPFSYEKFVSLLKGLGVNVEKKGTALQLSPLTDRHVIEMAGGHKGELKNPHLALRAKDLKEERGGLFDPVATGGIVGDKWSYIKLTEPMPNPIFVGSNNRPGPIPALLGLKLKELDEVMKGVRQIDGKTGGMAIYDALKKVDVDKELAALREKLPTLTGAALDRANKKFKYLSALKEAGLKPHEAYVMNVVPVIPPVFRPATVTQNGDVQYSSLNGLYKNIAILNNKLSEVDPKVFSEEHRSPLRWQLYDSLRALQSVGGSVGYDIDSPGSKRKLKGILDIIGGGEGEQPKEGYFQSKLVKRRQNLSIRSTIVPEPKLGIDEVGIPRGAAMELYKPFVVAELAHHGFDPLSAQQEMRNGTKAAYDALEKVIKERPLLLKRDPALHKFSIMAFTPRLVEGKAIQIHPLVTGGYNADFDGDTMAATVPLTREAVEEAKKMFPSKNLFSPTTGGVMYSPTQEALLGLHLLSKWGKPIGKTFSNPLELNKAVQRGEVHPTDVVKVGNKETTFGRLLLESRMPRDFYLNKDILHNPSFVIDKKTLNSQIITPLAKNHTREFASVVDELKNLGNEYSFKMGFSFGLKDLETIPQRDVILKGAHREAEAARRSIKDKDALNTKLIDIYQKATAKLEEAVKNTPSDNRLATMVTSGARGKLEQLRQMIAAPMLVQDSQNNIIPTPITKSYAEGLDIGDYWLAQHGARKGTLQRVLGTSEPGVVSKDIMNTTMSTLIVSPDCKTNHGLLMDVTHKDIVDRFTAKPYKLKDGTIIKAGTLLTPEILNRLKNSKIDKVLVRSPLKCNHGDGICAKCFGLNESGKLHDVGTNIGVLAGQALSEPAVQMAMDAFHTGGVATGRGSLSVDRLTRLGDTLRMPKKLKNSATLARVSGKVTDIKKDAVGGVDIFIGGERHYVPKHLVSPDIKIGTEVKKGMPISKGFINPHHLLPLTDIHTVRNFLTDEMYSGLYEKEGVRKRNVEVVVRALTNLTKIKDPGSSTFIHGDVAPTSIVEEFNRNLPKGKKPIVHEPMLRSIEQVPLIGSTDWMARLNYRELHNTIQQAAAQSWKSDIHGRHPIPGLAFGAEFGKPPPGKPKGAY
jgi:DNA-directed RNA polymerase subunit beta'